ncbi:acyltransferase [Phycicoccus sp. CSK15P-2]|uniref:acyltransferase family protein n=1 Tax=Phycicoccus sp. CSK15P-2 TaxID=2807627 RepID=UPI00194E38A1|nr:acyltransferase [Phycicoccus sp. CSK15P-2]MBM6404274.1 acyltransferase [Phycicoccus sp. CSK15P-2]
MSAVPDGGAQRFRELDGLRGLAALGVVVYHLTVAFDDVVPTAPASVVRVPWGMYGVQLFFLVSGFVILLTARRVTRPSDFVIARASRLYPAYWLALAVTTVVALTWSVWPRPSVATVLANLTMVQRWFLVENVDPVYWTLAVEMQFYLLVLGLLVVTRHRLGARVVLVTALLWGGVSLAVGLVAAPHSRGIDPQLVATPYKVLLNLTLAEFGPLFSAGCLAFLARHGELRWRWPVGFAALAVLMAAMLRDGGAAVAVAVVCALFLGVARRPSTPLLTARPLQWLGLVSYSLYVCHTALGDLVTATLLGPVGRELAMVAALVVVLGVARLLHSLGEVRGTRAMRRRLSATRSVVARRPTRTLTP